MECRNIYLNYTFTADWLYWILFGTIHIMQGFKLELLSWDIGDCWNHERYMHVVAPGLVKM